jgi:hypothetical protein
MAAPSESSLMRTIINSITKPTAATTIRGRVKKISSFHFTYFPNFLKHWFPFIE